VDAISIHLWTIVNLWTACSSDAENAGENVKKILDRRADRDVIRPELTCQF